MFGSDHGIPRARGQSFARRRGGVDLSPHPPAVPPAQQRRAAADTAGPAAGAPGAAPAPAAPTVQHGSAAVGPGRQAAAAPAAALPATAVDRIKKNMIDIAGHIKSHGGELRKHRVEIAGVRADLATAQSKLVELERSPLLSGRLTQQVDELQRLLKKTVRDVEAVSSGSVASGDRRSAFTLVEVQAYGESDVVHYDANMWLTLEAPPRWDLQEGVKNAIALYCHPETGELQRMAVCLRKGEVIMSIIPRVISDEEMRAVGGVEASTEEPASLGAIPEPAAALPPATDDLGLGAAPEPAAATGAGEDAGGDLDFGLDLGMGL